MSVLTPCIICMPGVHEGQKRVLEPLKLELQMVMSNNMDAGN